MKPASIMCPYLEDVKLLGANLFAGYVRSHVKGILLSGGVPFAMPERNPKDAVHVYHANRAQ